mgnify:CR=1 FL=1
MRDDGAHRREGFNLNVSRYISTAIGEEEIGLADTQRQLVEIEKQVREATTWHNGFPSEFGRLKDWRRVATRYDRCPKVFLSAVAIAATVMFWL